ncbi:ion channel [Flavobacterium myungsuense]|uniref:Ion channel n=1 Tax=Flavobacterium myungsuense TaxID=651823 RepID=A0ABW3J169_9FLAO
MELFKKLNEKAKSVVNSGFGSNANNYGGRFLNKDGSANVSKRGMNIFSRISWHHTMIELPSWKFLTILFAFYIVINFIFAFGYYCIGIEYLNGIDPSGSELYKFWKAFFFSTQTFTTVGYGHISPNGILSSALAATEALIGLLSFGIATGLFFGRFSKPTAYLKFSHNAIIAPYGEISALMLRTTPYKNTNFTDAEVKMTLGMQVEEDGKMTNKFYALDLELSKINLLTLSWTLVHPITENSPLYKFTKEDFENIEGEIMVFIKTFDNMFSAVVNTSTSYTFKEVIYGAKFEIMYSQNKSKTILHLDKLDSYHKVDID